MSYSSYTWLLCNFLSQFSHIVSMGSLFSDVINVTTPKKEMSVPKNDKKGQPKMVESLLLKLFLDFSEKTLY